MTHFLLPLLLSASTPVVRAVVYPDRAQVTRRASLPCGTHALITFDDLPPATDPATVRAFTSAGTIDGLRIEVEPRARAYAAESEALATQLRKLQADETVARDSRSRAESKLQLAQSYEQVTQAQLAHELASGKPDTAAWNQAVQQSLEARLQAARELTRVDGQLRALGRERTRAETRKAQLASAGYQNAYRAEVIVGCPAGQTASVELSYVVGGAGWAPAYEARASEGQSGVELSTYATVHQATGEAWKSAEITLSTAVPQASATPPEIEALRVSGVDIGEAHKVLVRRDEEARHAESAAASATTPSAGKPLAVAAQGLSVQLRVPEPADVAGDGSEVRLFVARTALPAKLALRAAPKLAPFVFWIADATNTAPFPLLPGPVDAFRNGGLSGRNWLEYVPSGAPLHLTFGIDEDVRVTRTVVEELNERHGLFAGGKRFRYAYKFELASYHREPRTVELSEHIPVSELDDVKVELEDKTTPVTSKRADDGILTWSLPLAPGQSKTVDLAFHVDVPSSYDASGL